MLRDRGRGGPGLSRQHTSHPHVESPLWVHLPHAGCVRRSSARERQQAVSRKRDLLVAISAPNTAAALSATLATSALSAALTTTTFTTTLARVATSRTTRCDYAAQVSGRNGGHYGWLWRRRTRILRGDPRAGDERCDGLHCHSCCDASPKVCRRDGQHRRI